MTTIINGIDELKSKVGDHVGYSDWHEVTQEQVNLFADATGDHQWIHIDVEEVMAVTGISMGVNYGLNKLRFPSPVPVGSKLRAGAKLLEVTDVSGGVQVAIEVTFEVEGGTKPVCVAEVLFRYYV
jgi:acyl dehydratase